MFELLHRFDTRQDLFNQLADLFCVNLRFQRLLNVLDAMWHLDEAERSTDGEIDCVFARLGLLLGHRIAVSCT